MDFLPSVIILFGTDIFEVRARKKEFRKEVERSGWEIRTLYSDDLSAIKSCRGVLGSFFSRKILFVVEVGSGFKDFSYLSEITGEDESKTAVLVYCEGKVPAGLKKLIKKTPKSYIDEYPLPPVYMQEEICEDFCLSYSRSQGLSMKKRAARLLVRRVGPDKIFLSYEIDKLGTMVDDGEIPFSLVKKESMRVMSSPVAILVDAVAAKDINKLNRALVLMEKYSSSPTMPVCRILGNNILQWMSVKTLMEKNLSVQEISQELGSKSKWVLENKVIPVARAWEFEDLDKILGFISETENLVFSGAADAWLYFVSEIEERLR